MPCAAGPVRGDPLFRSDRPVLKQRRTPKVPSVTRDRYGDVIGEGVDDEQLDTHDEFATYDDFDSEPF
jgi:hypothetical protein